MKKKKNHSKKYVVDLSVWFKRKEFPLNIDASAIKTVAITATRQERWRILFSEKVGIHHVRKNTELTSIKNHSVVSSSVGKIPEAAAYSYLMDTSKLKLFCLET